MEHISCSVWKGTSNVVVNDRIITVLESGISFDSEVI